MSGRFIYKQVINILDWIFEGIVNWVASINTQVMDAVSGIFLGALGTDMAVMEEYFPFVTQAFSIVQYMAWCLLFLITIWQLFRAFGGPITEAENPWHLVIRSAIFAVLIGFSKPIFGIVLDIARAPYTALMDSSMDPGSFTFAGIEAALTNGMTTLLGAISVVGLLLMVILMIALGWNYFKLLLEVVERYVVVGVLCYTSPLAFAMGGSKSTNRVFQSWCRMVGAQLLLLVLNVWFLRAFNSSVGQFVANGGALTSGSGNIFLWMFCALAFLKTAQRFDSHLHAIGLSVAQTGGTMAMEVMAASHMIGGFGGISKTAGNMFRGGEVLASAAGAAGASGIGGFMAGFASQLKGNSYVRDAVVQGGDSLGAGGGIGMVGRLFGSLAARNGATLTSGSIASVAARPPAVSGNIAGDIADRSLGNYMPHLANKNLSGTEITGGKISANTIGANGETASVQLFNAAQYEKPATPHSIVRASDGSEWYQVATGEGMGEFYAAPAFSGDFSEAQQVLDTFPAIGEGTMLRTVGDGVMEASYADGGNALMYNSACYQEPDAPHETITSADGVDWYAMQPNAEPPQFETDTPKDSGGTSDGGVVSDGGIVGTIGLGGYRSTAALPDSSGSAPTEATGFDAAAVTEYNLAQFQQFMPGYETQVSRIDSSRKDDGMLEVRHSDGSGTAFYDRTMYQAPRGDYNVYEDSKGGQWYAISGTPTVERKPVYENGKPVYDGDSMRTVNVEGIKYKSTLTRFSQPKVRDPNDRTPPKRKQV